MPRGRRTMNRFDLRAANDAAERRAEDEEEVEEEEDAEEEEEEPSDEAEEEEAAAEEEEEEEGDEEGDEDAPPKKKPKAKAKPKAAKAPAKPKRTREKKIVRMKVLWAVFNNSNQRVAAFDYPKRNEADALATKLSTEKKSTHFVQPVKEPIEEKKEEK